MTTVAVLCDPPRPGQVLGNLVATSPLSETEAAELYEALLKDTVAAVDKSGGELLVNYRADEDIETDGEDSEAEIRAAIEDVVDVEEARFEVQVGETFAGRVGNTATHLLENEELSSVGITRPEAAFLARTEIDEGAMKLRSTDAVVAPSPGGRVYYAALGEPIDFSDCFAAPAFETLVDRCLDAGLDVEFSQQKTYIETGADLADALTQVRTRRKSGGLVPKHFAEWAAETDLVVDADEGGLSLTR
jgi:2-phospho-L-lactate guanylyltransferase (CobY/MobA/RfbA family)